MAQDQESQSFFQKVIADHFRYTYEALREEVEIRKKIRDRQMKQIEEQKKREEEVKLREKEKEREEGKEEELGDHLATPGAKKANKKDILRASGKGHPRPPKKTP